MKPRGNPERRTVIGRVVDKGEREVPVVDLSLGFPSTTGYSRKVKFFSIGVPWSSIPIEIHNEEYYNLISKGDSVQVVSRHSDAVHYSIEDIIPMK